MKAGWAVQERTGEDVEGSFTHFDQDYELAYYARRKMQLSQSGKLTVVGSTYGADGPGTLFSGIPAELLYHDQGTPNTAVAGTAAEVIMNLINPFGQSAQLPAG